MIRDTNIREFHVKRRTYKKASGTVNFPDIRILLNDFSNEQGQHFTNIDIIDRWFTWFMNNCDYDSSSKRPPNVASTGTTFPAVSTRARIAIRSYTSFRRSYPQCSHSSTGVGALGLFIRGCIASSSSTSRFLPLELLITCFSRRIRHRQFV